MDACDVLVIGGGIHGVGVAQAVAAAGHDVLLVERTALAAGTSSKSSKLIHGGLRYLESGDLRLVRESLRERELLVRIAPTLVRRSAFHLPIYGGARRPAWQVRCGLSLYALLAGLGPHTRFRGIPRREWDALDGLETRDLQAIFRYPDAQADDAELTRAVMRSAEGLGARLLAPCSVTFAREEPPGWRVECATPSGELFSIATRVVVNAAGPWVNVVAKLLRPGDPAFSVELVQGTHLELPTPLKMGCYYAEVPSDHRYVFVLPWKGRTLVGTTETPFQGDPVATRPLPTEIDYLLAQHARLFPAHDRQVLAAWSGLRVLPGPESGARFTRSRETRLIVHPSIRPTLLTILGGKLTGYRLTAARVLRRMTPTLPKRKIKALTQDLILD